MSPLFVTILTYAAVLLALASLVSLGSDVFSRYHSRVRRRLDDEFHKNQREQIRQSPLFKDLHKLAAEVIGAEEDIPLTWRGRWDRRLEQSGLGWSFAKLAGLTAGAAIGSAILGIIIRPNLLVAAVAALVGGVLPSLYVKFKQSRRLEALRAQLPDAYDLIARALRAGQTISQTMQGVADEFSEPIAGEFSLCYEQQNLGLPTDVALRDLAARTGLAEINIFVVAVVVQRQVGGNLAEMLERLARVVRERFRIHGAIRTLTAEGRMQAGILMSLPPAIFLAMLLLNREYALVLLGYPWLLVGVVVSMGIGALWIRQIINFDF